MAQFNHRNVLSLIGVCIDAGKAPYLVMPFMEMGSLLSYLRKERAQLTILGGAGDEMVMLLIHQTLVYIPSNHNIADHRGSKETIVYVSSDSLWDELSGAE